MNKLDLTEVVVETSVLDELRGEAGSGDSLSPIDEEAGSAAKETSPELGPAGVAIGILVGFLESGEPLVDFPGNRSGKPLPARSTVGLEKRHSGRSAVLLFEEVDRRKPIIAGLLDEPQPMAPVSTAQTATPLRNYLEIEADGDRLVVSAEKEIVLRCGEASITLTRAGKVLLRGTYLVSRSSGMNRIKGGAVQIN